MNINVLISCMHEKDTSIIGRSNIQTDVVVVNQCDTESVDEFDFLNKKGKSCHAKFINTTERGLSRSRNMAVNNAWGDICLICDDDEVLADDYEYTILRAYGESKENCIVFSLIRKDISKQYPKSSGYFGIKQCFHISSQQITFKKSFIQTKGIVFDEKMGSGTGNGGGEENKFIMDIRRAGSKIYYDSNVIATVQPGKSQWFTGYTENFFENRGWAIRRIFGFLLGYIYIWINIIRRKTEFTKDGLSIFNVIKCIHRGFFSKR